jgi:hypothetical protein
MYKAPFRMDASDISETAETSSMKPARSTNSPDKGSMTTSSRGIRRYCDMKFPSSMMPCAEGCGSLPSIVSTIAFSNGSRTEAETEAEACGVGVIWSKFLVYRAALTTAEDKSPASRADGDQDANAWSCMQQNNSRVTADKRSIACHTLEII